MLVFGPVPSRRLGRSLGVNNIPPKHCTYSCAYCQIGRTRNLQFHRRNFYEPECLLRDVEEKLELVSKAGESVDFLTFVADGEPTLDVNLGQEIELLKKLGIKIAVITNASLIWRSDVREELIKADWVSLKIDTVNERVWHQINRPHGKIKLESILGGLKDFARMRDVQLNTETMLVRGMITADHPMRKEAVINFLEKADGDWTIIQRMIHQHKLVETDFNGNKFYFRKFASMEK